MLLADLVRNFSQFLVVADFVLEFGTVLERHGIHHEMAVNVICVQVDGDEYLISVAPHSSCGFLADCKRLFRRDLALTKTLYSVITNNFPTQAEPPLHGDHLRIGVLFGAVDAAHKHLPVGLAVVLHIA